MAATKEQLSEKLQAFEQDHLLAYWDELDEDGKEGPRAVGCLARQQDDSGHNDDEGDDGVAGLVSEWVHARARIVLG